VISAAENTNKISKTRFWKEKSVEDVVTFEGLSFNSSMISFHIWLFKKSIHTLQNNVHMLSFPIVCNWFTLGAMSQVTLVIMISQLQTLSTGGIIVIGSAHREETTHLCKIWT
jgi:hypothetical protein